MSLEGRLESVVQDGDEVVLTYREGDNTHMVRRLPLPEFERQFGMLALFNKNKEPVKVEKPEIPEINTLQELANFRTEVMEEMRKRESLLRASYDSLKDFMTTAVLQREKLSMGLQESASKSLTSVTSLLEQSKAAQDKALESIVTKDQTIRAIMTDLETRKEWTWDAARRVQKEVEASVHQLNEFKGKTEKQLTDMNVALTAKMNSFDGMLQKLTTDREVMLKGVIADAERLIAQHRAALDEKTDLLRMQEINLYKQTYLDNELVRRMAVESEKAGIAQRQFDTFQRKVEDALGAVKEKLVAQQKKLDNIFHESRAADIDALLQQDGLADLKRAILSETAMIENLKAQLEECENRAVRVRDLMMNLVKAVQDAPSEVFDLVTKLDKQAQSWADKVGLLETELTKRGALKELTKVEVTKEVVEEKLEEKKGFFKRVFGK
jgi:hypothetical protein